MISHIGTVCGDGGRTRGLAGVDGDRSWHVTCSRVNLLLIVLPACLDVPANLCYIPEFGSLPRPLPFSVALHPLGTVFCFLG